MPLSAADKSGLQADVQTLSDHITALVVDPTPNPIQVQLDSANQTIATLTGVLNGVKTRAQARKAADDAKEDGQDDLDALAAAGL